MCRETKQVARGQAAKGCAAFDHRLSSRPAAMATKRVAPAAPQSDSRLGWTLAVGAGLHLALAASPLPAILVDRNELTTPITSWTRRVSFPTISDTR